MKLFATIIAIAFAALTATAQTAQPQTITYEIDPVQRDSFFLVETVTTAPTVEVPRPATTVASQLFKGPDDLEKFIAKLLEEAKKLKAEAAQKVDGAKRIERMAESIEKARQDHRAFLKLDKKKP